MNAEIKGRNILLVDDSPDLLLMTQLLLSAAGAEVVATTDPFAVEGLVRMQRPDILFTDIMMPGRSGFEVAKGVRTLLPDISVILASCDDENEGICTGINNQMVPDQRYFYLQKPFDIEDLLRVVSGACAIRESIVAA